MKIFYISDSRVPSRFANSIHVMKMCQAFADLGHKVTLFAKRGDEPAENVFDFYGVENSFRLVTLKPFNWMRQYHRVPFVVQLLSCLRRDDVPDLFYSRNSYVLGVITNRNVPVVFEAHNSPRNSIERMCLNALFKCRNFKRLVTISYALKDIYLNQFEHLDESQVVVAPDGAVENLSEPQRMGSPERLKVGYAGHLYEGRGVEIILGLARLLKDCEFHLIGGFDKDIDEWKKSPQMSDNVFFHGFVSPRNADQFRANMDILLAPYQKSVAVANNQGNTVDFMSPLKIFEYMAAGKAIIASDLPAIREVLTNQKSALLVPCDDIQKWSYAVNLLRDENQRKQMGETAKSLFMMKYTWASRAKHIWEKFI